MNEHPDVLSVQLNFESQDDDRMTSCVSKSQDDDRMTICLSNSQDDDSDVIDRMTMCLWKYHRTSRVKERASEPC
jgi:hypothetical protein